MDALTVLWGRGTCKQIIAVQQSYDLSALGAQRWEETVLPSEVRDGFLEEGTLGPDIEDGVGICLMVKWGKGQRKGM